jgi:hypothetical protein
VKTRERKALVAEIGGRRYGHRGEREVTRGSQTKWGSEKAKPLSHQEG